MSTLFWVEQDFDAEQAGDAGGAVCGHVKTSGVVAAGRPKRASQKSLYRLLAHERDEVFLSFAAGDGTMAHDVQGRLVKHRICVRQLRHARQAGSRKIQRPRPSDGAEEASATDCTSCRRACVRRCDHHFAKGPTLPRTLLP